MLRLPRFRYLQPASLSEAVRMMSDLGPDAMYVAGGTDLYPNMKRRQQMPKVVIGLSQLKQLRAMKGKPAGGIVLGAGLTLTDVTDDRSIQHSYRAVAKAAELISTPLLRNMGSIGGNLLLDTRCNYYNQNYEWRKAIHFCMKKDGETCWVAPSSPRCWAVQSSDCAPVMVAIGAKVKLVSSSGERLIGAAELYRDDGIQHLNKRPDELLTEIHLPQVNGWRATYWKLRRRGSFDFPVLGVATCVRLAGDGTVEDAKIVLGGVGSFPLEVDLARRAIIGKKLTDETIHEASAAAYPTAKPLDNTDFAMHWRKDMARYYVGGTLRELAGLPPSFPRPGGDNGSPVLRVL
ncbi:MAG TPA: FAD binding domain-containing protein [Bryobacteraceae bacterium]|nr:FAD binding domain-containing protein [Bryobacteraceae bacterium]